MNRSCRHLVWWLVLTQIPHLCSAVCIVFLSLNLLWQQRSVWNQTNLLSKKKMISWEMVQRCQKQQKTTRDTKARQRPPTKRIVSEETKKKMLSTIWNTPLSSTLTLHHPLSPDVEVHLSVWACRWHETLHCTETKTHKSVHGGRPGWTLGKRDHETRSPPDEPHTIALLFQKIPSINRRTTSGTVPVQKIFSSENGCRARAFF